MKRMSASLTRSEECCCVRLMPVSDLNQSLCLHRITQTPRSNRPRCLSLDAQVDGLRKEIDQLLLRKIEEPSYDLSASKVVEAVLKLLVHDGF